jgi:hypothetical protein
MRANVQASHPDSPRRVRTVWRRLYNTNGRTPASRRAFLCCFLRLDGSTCPLNVGAGHIQPSSGLRVRSQRLSKMARTGTGNLDAIPTPAWILPLLLSRNTPHLGDGLVCVHCAALLGEDCAGASRAGSCSRSLAVKRRASSKSSSVARAPLPNASGAPDDCC